MTEVNVAALGGIWRDAMLEGRAAEAAAIRAEIDAWWRAREMCPAFLLCVFDNVFDNRTAVQEYFRARADGEADETLHALRQPIEQPVGPRFAVARARIEDIPPGASIVSHDWGSRVHVDPVTGRNVFVNEGLR